jgi:outer membrane PBP1 activator LpoA protein
VYLSGSIAARALHPLENLARLYQSKGHWSRAKEEWHNLLERARELGYWSSEAIARCGLGATALEQGNLVEARTLLREAELLVAKGQGWSEARVQWQMLAARIATAEGEPKRAIELLLEAEAALPPRYAFRWGTLRYYRAIALARIDAAAAAALLHDCIKVFNRIDAQPMRAAAQKLLIEMGRLA